ncbi:MAG TPA: DUF3341 domain-containing protein [Methylorubrum populi]|uniref:DUF3341 domain-containing protein n=1 Tax=Methylorubrum populi TaxID=223967 RepID=A0A921E660_9HYPH|nr:DUF3341 domain-containing protein [Methylorubrum populi]
MAAPSLPLAAPADPLYGAPVIGPGETSASIGDKLAGSVLAPAQRGWRAAAAGAGALILACAGLRWTLAPALLDGTGAGWWIGLAAGGLLISGLLLLAGVEWRGGISRLTQTAALLCAGLAALHPAAIRPIDSAGLLAASLGLWAVALLPDLAVLRDRLAGQPETLRTRLYRAAASGWRGSAMQWLVWERACRGLALVGIVVAVAVLTDLALAFSPSIDRHNTLRPVALLVEAVLSGAGLMAALAVALRRFQGLDGLITGRHLDILGRLILAFGLAALYCHVTDGVTALLYGDADERAALARRLLGDAAPAFWSLMIAGLLPTQLFWIGAVRRSAPALGLIGAVVAAGLRADRGAITLAEAGATGSGHVSALPDALLVPFLDGLAGAAAFLGPVGLFILGLLLILRLVPPVSIAEARHLALARNAGAGPVHPEPMPASRAGLGAVFASEAGLAEAARGLSVLERPPRLDAFGPVPLPEAAAALHREERTVSRLALLGAGLGAGLFLTVQGAGAGLPAASEATASSWALLALPAACAAALGAAIGIGLALAFALPVFTVRMGRPHFAPPPGLGECFVLTVLPSAGSSDPAALIRRLRGLPEFAGRPLAVYGPVASEPRR